MKYNLVKFSGYLGLALLLYAMSVYVIPGGAILKIMFHTFLLVVFAGAAYLVEKPGLASVR